MANMHEKPSDYNVFQKSGHPGRWVSSTEVTTSDVSFSGSAVYGGVIVSGSHNAQGLLDGQCDHVIELSSGGSIVANVLQPGLIHELSVQYVVGAAAGKVYVLKRNG